MKVETNRRIITYRPPKGRAHWIPDRPSVDKGGLTTYESSPSHRSGAYVTGYNEALMGGHEIKADYLHPDNAECYEMGWNDALGDMELDATG